jgi:hypothetical protein
LFSEREELEGDRTQRKKRKEKAENVTLVSQKTKPLGDEGKRRPQTNSKERRCEGLSNDYPKPTERHQPTEEGEEGFLGENTASPCFLRLKDQNRKRGYLIE